MATSIAVQSSGKNRIRFLALALWASGVMVSQIYVTDWQAYVQTVQSGIARNFQLAAFATFFMIWALTLENVKNFDKKLLTNSGLLVSAFITYLIVSSLFSLNVLNSLAYSLLILIIFVVLSTFQFKNGGNFSSPMSGVAIMIALAMLMLLVVHGGFGSGESGRNVGGIRANTFAKFALAGLMASSISRKTIVKLLGIFFMFCILAVESRGGTLFAIVFLGYWYVLPLMMKRSTFALTYGIIFASFSLGILAILLSPVGNLISDFLALADDRRGVSSGLLTGRLDYWGLAIGAISENPIFGYGFRTRGTTISQITAEFGQVNAHQGYLNLLLDLGIMGFVLFFTSLFSVMRRSKLLEVDYEYRARKAIILTVLVTWLFEPVYLNLGIPLSILFFCAWLFPVNDSSDESAFETHSQAYQPARI